MEDTEDAKTHGPTREYKRHHLVAVQLIVVSMNVWITDVISGCA